jgi:hypothetical protein
MCGVGSVAIEIHWSRESCEGCEMHRRRGGDSDTGGLRAELQEGGLYSLWRK